MKKLIALFAAIASLGLSSAVANFDLQGWFCDISAVGSIGFESEDHIYGKKIAEDTFVSGIEFTMPVCDGCTYLGVTGFFPFEEGSQSTRATDDKPAHLGDAGNRFEIKVGYMMPVLCVPAPECFCMDDTQVSIDLGYKYYWWTEHKAHNPWNNVNRSNEIYAGILTDMFLRPAAYFFYDWNLEQFRFELSIGYTYNLGCFSDCLDRFAIDANAYVAWLQADDYYGDQAFADGLKDTDNGYTYGGVSVDLVYCLNECADIRAGVRWEANNDGGENSKGSAGLRMNQGDESRCWWGASVNYGF